MRLVLSSIEQRTARRGRPARTGAAVHASLRRAAAGALLLVLLLPAWSSTAAGHPTESFPPDARPQGMAGAFTAVAEGPFAVCWNPAGLAHVQPISIAPYSRTERLPGVDREPYGYAFGATGHWGPFGLGAAFTTIGGWHENDSAGFASGRTLWLGGGVDVTHYTVPRWKGLSFSVGATLKHVSELSGRRYGHACHGIPATWDVDLGALLAYRLRGGRGGVELAAEPRRPKKLTRTRYRYVPLTRSDDGAYLGGRLGLSVRNVFHHRVACVADEAYRPLDPSARFGAALKAGTAVAHPLGRVLSLLVSVEEELLREREDPLTGEAATDRSITRAGGEVTLLGLLAARGGWSDDPHLAAEGWSWGLGIGFDTWQPHPDVGQLGLRLDFARVPQAAGEAERPEHWTLALWVVH